MAGIGIAHNEFKVAALNGRYLTPDQILQFYTNYLPTDNFAPLGNSVEGRPIHGVTLGKGKKKILMWSQMHGNESTTTKAVADLIYFLLEPGHLAEELLRSCQLQIIGMLNPDGAIRYTRENARGVDLNRDAAELTQPESKLLRKAYDSFCPDYCFNLHDQRTIYNVGASQVPATLSFLAPSRDSNREIDTSREISMQIIAAINNALQQQIPGGIGRYDDAFNPNCIGDTLQMLGTPTILFEAGHFPADYQREVTREYVFYALIEAITTIARETYREFDIDAYFQIPENEKRYFDILIRNVAAMVKNMAIKEDLGLMLKEELHEGKIVFIPYVEQRGNLSKKLGHATYDYQDPQQRKFLERAPFAELLNI